jgi:RHS repeat-associated protein
MNGQRGLLTWLAVVSILATAFVSASADQPVTALAPIETLLDGRNELVGVAVLADGTRYVSDRGAGVVYRVSPSGTVTTAASGLSRPAGLALDGSGRLLIAEEQAGRVMRLESSGSLTVLATGIKTPRWLAVNPDGSVYITAHRLTGADGPDTSEGRTIVRLSATGVLSVVATGIRQLQGITRLNGALIAASKGLESGADSAGMLLRFTVNADGTLGAPTAWISTGLKQPVGLVLDALAALYSSSKELTTDVDTSKRAIAKVHQDLHLSDFASNLTDPQGLALDPDGSLYLADGKGGRLLRFRAPAPPTLSAPAFTKLSPLTVTGTTEAGARVDLFLNDATTPVTATADSAGAFAAQLTLTVDHTNTLEAFATTFSSNGLTSAPREATIVHDGQAPALTFQAPPANAYVRLSVNVEAQASDGSSSVNSLALTVDGTTLSTTVTPSLPAPSATATATWLTTSVPDGTHTLGATATDRAGNSASISRVVIVDNTAPDTQITGGPVGEINVGTAAFTFTGTDNLTPVGNLQFSWRLDGGAFTAFGPATTASLSGLTEGTHTFEVKARDLAGNEDPTPATRAFTVRFGPSITNLDPASGPVGTFVTITGTLFEPGATTVSFGGLTAIVRTETATQITTTVPIGAVTGPVTVTTTRGSASRNFTVTATGDFTLTAAPSPPAKVRVVAGDQGSARIDVGGSGSFTSLVSLGVSAPPAGITASFSPPLVAPGSGSYLAFAVADTVSPGTYSFTVTGQAEVDGQPQSRTTTVTLEVLAAGTPAVTGRVLTAEALPKPIPGVTVTLGSAFTLTDAAGNFVMLAPPTGPNMLVVDGRTASTATAQYPLVEAQINVSATGPTRVPFVLYLPKLDTANPIALPLNAAGATTQEVRATTPLMPGLVVTIPAGTRINGPDGNPVAQITITPVPIDRSPMPFPPGVKPPMLFAIQPGGAVPSNPLPITFPNRTRATPGTGADLYYFDLAIGNWRVWGRGTVSEDGASIVSDPGFGLPRFAWHFPAVAFVDTIDEGGPQDPDDGDPVDVAIGRFTLRRTDMFLPGRLGLTIDREYRSENPRAGLFGIGWNLAPYDTVLTTSGTSLLYVLPNRTSFRFTPDGPNRWTNTTDPFLRGAVVTQTGTGLNFQLRFKDGTVYRYAPTQVFTNAAVLAAINDRNGNTVTVTRTTVGTTDRITQVTEGTGRVIALSYDGAGRIITVTDPLGRIVQYGYDNLGRLQAVTDPAGGVTRYTYDSAHRLLTITDTRGITFIQNVYDATGRVVRQVLGDGSTWTFDYVLNGDVVTQTVVTDPRGGRTTHRFDARGFPLSRTDALGGTTTFDREPGSNLVLASTDVLRRTTRFAYDALGNVATIVGPTGATRAFTYEPTFGRPTQRTDEAGRITRFEYDGHGNLVTLIDPSGARTTSTYDGFGQILTTTNAVPATTGYAYDSQGNRIAVTDPVGHTSRFSYDSIGRLVRSTDARGRATTFTYNPVNRLTEVRDPAGGTTTYAYDPNGNLLRLTSPSGGTISRSYDALGRLATQTDPLGVAESFAYDSAGNLLTYTDRAHRAQTNVYDVLGRRIATTYADGTAIRTSYDAVGRVSRVDDSVGGVILNRYDERDRLVSQVTPDGTVSYGYDVANRRVRVDIPGGAMVTYGYDANSRLTDVSKPGSAAHLTYDPAGRRTSLSLPNGVVTEYGYDAASRLTSLVYRTPASVLGELTYQYDAAGYRTRVGGALAETLLPPAAASATYDAGNRQLAFGDAHTTFDANGNATSISGPSGVTGLEWDARNRLIRVSSPGVTAEYTYDGFGRRIRKRVGGADTRYVYDGVDIVQELTTGGPVSYVHSNVIDELLMIERPEGRSFPAADGVGSTVLVTNEAGATAARYLYEPFGATMSTNPGFPNAFRFTGRELDETGLYHYRARYYDPRAHRFVSEDPLGIAAGLNVYAYVNNNPLKFVDPLGLDLQDADIIPAGFRDFCKGAFLALCLILNNPANLPSTGAPTSPTIEEPGTPEGPRPGSPNFREPAPVPTTPEVEGPNTPPNTGRPPVQGPPPPWIPPFEFFPFFFLPPCNINPAACGLTPPPLQL